jgi:hypothetical protein
MEKEIRIDCLDMENSKKLYRFLYEYIKKDYINAGEIWIKGRMVTIKVRE